MNVDEFIKVENVMKAYHMGEVSIHALKETSFTIKEGEFVIIVGPSGAGKTTVLNVLGGMDTVTEGLVYVDGTNIAGLKEKELTKYRRDDIGFVFQFYNLIQNLTVKENVELAAQICKDPLDAREVLKEVGLGDRMINFPAQLSGGEQQRVAIARALAKNPKLLLCDEPTGALDYMTGKSILKLLQDTCRQRSMTVIVITHNTALTPMADRVIHMKNGKVISMKQNEQPIDKIDDFIVFRNRTTQKAYQLNENDIILSEQIANQIGAKAGDRIAIKNENKTEMVKVAEVTENYMMHYIYMSPVLYEKIYGRKPDYNQIYLLLGNEEKEIEQQVGNSLLNNPAVKGVFYISYFRNLLSNMLVSLNIVVGVLIVAAGALAFIVLYNLNNININERRRELATIKVLGFYNNELTAYVYRENIILTIFGAGVGVGLGILLHRYVIETVEINMVMFGRIINPESYIYSILLTFFFSAFVNFTMMFKLKNINMVESLKSVE